MNIKQKRRKRVIKREREKSVFKCGFVLVITTVSQAFTILKS